jgi:signal transduction histidine kinase
LPRRALWLLTRIRTKLIFLHTLFSLALAVALLLALRAPLRDMLREAELGKARLALDAERAVPGAIEGGGAIGVEVRAGSAEALGLDARSASAARAARGPVAVRTERDAASAVEWSEARGEFVMATGRLPEAREAINRAYLLLTIALLAVYGLIALTLEVFVLPKQVYEPIGTLRSADVAVQEGRRAAELIPESRIPRDELGEIMRSRNRSILKLREQEEALNGALQQVETIANELKRKNHLLESARRNLADQDRLASLGMMSAGIAHELNTPLAVLKGCVEELAESGAAPSAARGALMLRTVRRLERLSEGLLDFARVRPGGARPIRLREVVEDAWTLVSLDRGPAEVALLDEVGGEAMVEGDADRLTQVLVNLLRNSVDAMRGGGTVRVSAEESERDGRRWVSLTIADTGPGIDPAVLPRLFEPFLSTKLDSHGTGLGLAIAEGIVREHGGLILARNAPTPPGGAVFEVMLPRVALQSGEPSVEGRSEAARLSAGAAEV